MPLHILIILVVAGIGGIALLLHLSGRSALARLDDAAARDGWARHFPEDDVYHVTVSRDGSAALVQTSAGPGVIWAFGADTVARHLRDCAVTEDRAGLRVDFHDYAAPPVTFHLSPQERDAWRAELEPT